MNKICKIASAIMLALVFVSCAGPKDGTFEATANGYGGEVKVAVTIADEKITNIDIIEEKETLVVAERAFPLIIERIIEANTPVVDAVSGATFTSYAVKAAVADAMNQAGLEEHKITFMTQGPEHEAVTLDDVSTDLLVVGGGPSGLAAAIAAKETNPSINVILIEKLDILSGNGKFNLGMYDLFNTKAQRDIGGEVSKDVFIASKQNSGETAERIQAWADGTEIFDDWLRSHNITLDYVSNKTSTSVYPTDKLYGGEMTQRELEKSAYALGIDIRTGTKGLELVLDGDTVVGVSVETNKNETYTIYADITLLATGGYSNNKELLEKYSPGIEKFNTSNQMGTTGDFVAQFEELGYSLMNMDSTRVFPTVLVGANHLTGGADLSLTVDENGTARPTGTPGHFFYITDQAGYDSHYRIRKHTDYGYYQTAQTIEEIAAALGIDAAGLQATIDEYNAKDGIRRPFGEGPYYGAKVQSAIHMTKGGLETNVRGQALTSEGEVVEGLYASGEVTYQSGGYAQSTVWGMLAGEEAANALR